VQRGGSKGIQLQQLQNKPYTFCTEIALTRGQLRYEFALLRSRLNSRDPEKYKELEDAEEIEPHPLFYVTNGDIATWERAKMEILKEKDVK
jgi:hypothetical protein